MLSTAPITAEVALLALYFADRTVASRWGCLAWALELRGALGLGGLAALPALWWLAGEPAVPGSV